MVVFVLIVDAQDSAVGVGLPIDQVVCLLIIKVDLFEYMLTLAEIFPIRQVLEALAHHLIDWQIGNTHQSTGSLL